MVIVGIEPSRGPDGWEAGAAAGATCSVSSRVSQMEIIGNTLVNSMYMSRKAAVPPKVMDHSTQVGR